MTRHVGSGARRTPRSAGISALSAVGSPGNPAPRVGSVGVLLFTGRPPAVARLVVPVAVDPVDGVIEAGPLAHVGEEVLEGRPARAERDTPAPVAIPRSIVRVGASRPQRGPTRISRSARPSMLERGRTLTGVRRQLRLGLIGVRSATKGPGSPCRELSGITQRMLAASTSRFARQCRPLSFGQPPPGQRRAYLRRTSIDHCAVMAGATASGRALLTDSLLVASTGTSRLASGHGSMITDHQERSL